jgi:hypothetical protein
MNKQGRRQRRLPFSVDANRPMRVSNLESARSSEFWMNRRPSVSNWLSNSPPRSVKPTAPRSLEVPLTTTQSRPF